MDADRRRSRHARRRGDVHRKTRKNSWEKIFLSCRPDFGVADPMGEFHKLFYGNVLC
jgi:hypothetical protein